MDVGTIVGHSLGSKVLVEGPHVGLTEGEDDGISEGIDTLPGIVGATVDICEGGTLGQSVGYLIDGSWEFSGTIDGWKVG